MGKRGPKRRPIADRLVEKIMLMPSGCWNWTASKDRLGYGRIGRGGKYGGMMLAHRASYEWLVGPIPEGLSLDHLCRNTSCVNPTHLEPVTHHENLKRGNTFTAANLAKTHCKHGHELSGRNIMPRRPGRICRTCRNADKRRARQRAKALI